MTFIQAQNFNEHVSLSTFNISFQFHSNIQQQLYLSLSLSVLYISSGRNYSDHNWNVNIFTVGELENKFHLSLSLFLSPLSLKLLSECTDLRVKKKQRLAHADWMSCVASSAEWNLEQNNGDKQGLYEKLK